jgi:peptide/nickel transport system substrate-binding protein
VHFKIIQSGATAWNAAKLGQLDETSVQSDIWLRERENSALQERLNFVDYYGLAYNYIAWNGRLPIFSDKRMRRAMAMCINVRSIITNLYGGTARVLTGHFLPGQDGFNPAVPSIEYDPEAAKQLLTSLGWLDTNGDGILDRGGKPLSFDLMITTGSTSAQSIAQLMQADLKKVGIRMEIAVVDFAALMQRILAGNYQAAYLSWDLDADPDPYGLFHSSQTPPRGFNFTFYSNPEADRLIEQARREFDEGKRAEMYRQLHAILAEDQPYAWMVQPTVKWVLNKRVRNARLGRGYGLFLWTPGELDWWLADARPSPVRPQPAVATSTGN